MYLLLVKKRHDSVDVLQVYLPSEKDNRSLYYNELRTLIFIKAH